MTPSKDRLLPTKPAVHTGLFVSAPSLPPGNRFAAVGPDGRVSVVFHDRRNDPSNRFANVYLARSSNGGVDWSEIRVSTESSNLNWTFDRGVFMGDYNGLTVGPTGTAYPFWTDSRNGEPSIRQSDVFIAIVPP